MEERPVPTEVEGANYAPPPVRMGRAYPAIDPDLEKDFGITLAEESDKLADLSAHSGAGWGPHGGPGEPENPNVATSPPWLRESSGYAIQPGFYEGETSLEGMGEDRYGSVSASVYSSKKDPWERSGWTCFKTRRRRIGCCMCCLMSFLIISGFAVGFYIQIAALISGVNLRVESVDIVDACKQPMTVLLGVTVNNPSWLVVDVSRLVLTLRDSSSGQERSALTVRLQEGVTISVARWATTSVVVPVDVYPGDSFKLNWDVGTDGSSPAGGGMGNLGLLEGYESNLGVDLRLLFMGDVPLSYSFEQSLGNIWSAQTSGNSSPVQSESSSEEVECTTKCMWTTFPDECCNMLDGWGFSVSQINFDLVSFIDVMVEWKLYSDFIKMHQTPNISTVIVPVEDPRDAVEFHIGKHHNVTNVAMEERDSIGRFRLLMFEKNGVEMLRKLAHEPSSSDRWVLRFQESQLSSGSPNDTCALQVALANVTATFRVSDISKLASSTLPGAGRRDSDRDSDDAHQHLRGVSEREGRRRRAMSTKIDFDSLFNRLQLDYGGYFDPETSKSGNGTSSSNEFKFIVSFTNPLPEGRFSANTPTVWAGIAPTPVAGTAVEKDDSPMARVGVQATRFSMVPGERQELVMLGDFLESSKIGTYFVEPMINGLSAKLRIKKVVQLYQSFLSLSVNSVLDGVDFQLSTGLASPMRSILNYLKIVKIVESPYPSKDMAVSLRIGQGIPKAWGQIPLVTMRHWIGDTAYGAAKITQVASEAGTTDDLEVLLTLDDALSSCNPILSSIFFGTSNSVKIQLTIGQLEVVAFNWNITTSFLSTVPVMSYNTRSTAYYKEETCGVSSGRVLGRFCNPFASSLSFMVLEASGRLQLEGRVDMGGWAHTFNETTSRVASIGDCIPLNASQPIGNSTSSAEQQDACKAARLSKRPLSRSSDAVTVGGVICTCKAGIGKCTDSYLWRDDSGDERWLCVAAAKNLTNITLCRV